MTESGRELYRIFAECFPFISMSEEIFFRKISYSDNKLFIRYSEGIPYAFSVVNENTIVLICVHPDHQNHGTGSSLLRESEDYIISCGYHEAVLGRGKNRFFFGAVIDTFSHRFFEHRGYFAVNGCLSMFMDLSDFNYDELSRRYPCSSEIQIFFCPDKMKQQLIKSVAEVEPRWVSKYSDHTKVLVAADGDEVAAFVLLNDNAETPATAEGFRTGMPEYIGVTEKYRRKHIGTALMLKAAEFFRSAGCNDVYIEYTSEDTWYSRIGFEDYLWYWMGKKSL